MKLMKLGTRPDSFFTSGLVRSVYTEVATDLQIQVDHCLFRLHKFPLLSKCLLLQSLCADTDSDAVVELPNFPGGADAFEACAKFCYGVAITVGSHNVVPLRCAAARLGMTDADAAADRPGSNLAGKLDAFLASCLLRRWKDALAVLRSCAGVRGLAAECEELGVTSRCVEAVAMLITNPGGRRIANANAAAVAAASSSAAAPWWARDVSDLCVDLFWRVMVAVKAAGTVNGRAIGDALRIYARRWLPTTVARTGGRGYLLVAVEQTTDVVGTDAEGTSAEVGPSNRSSHSQQLLVEKLVSLLPAERDAVSCGFFLKLLKAGNLLGGGGASSSSSRAELARRAALQLEDATVSDLLIPSSSRASDDTVYDVDAVIAILEELALLQAAAPAASSPPHAHEARGGHRRSRSAESAAEFEGARRRRSTSAAAASHGAMVRIGRLVDGFLVEVAKDPNMPLDKFVAVAEAVPDCARPDHDRLYRAVDTYLRVHPEMSKGARKKLCRVLNCRKLSETASMHAARNELLPLRVVVQVLFFENARAAAAARSVPSAVPGANGGRVKALLGRTRREAGGGGEEEAKDEHSKRGHAVVRGDDNDNDNNNNNDWSVEGLKRAASRISTLQMKMEEEEEEEDADDEAFVHSRPRRRAGSGLVRSASARVRALCANTPGKPKRMLSRLWPSSSSRAVTQSQRH